MRRTVCLISLLMALGSPHVDLRATKAPFPYDQSQKTPATPQPVQQAIRGTTYENVTAHFTLTVPKDWFVGENLMKQLPGIIGALDAPGGSVAIMVQRYYVP